MSDGSVEFEIRADNSQAKQAIQDTTNSLKSAAGQWENSTVGATNATQSFGSSLSGVGAIMTGVIAAGAAKAGQAMLAFGKECISAASDLAETQNVVNTVFGDQASQIYNWAQSAQTAFGLTQTQALRYSSTLGAMMKSSGVAQNEIVEMSTALSGLAADMASFYNMDFDTAFEKLRSGISGETEPLKALGINLSVANLEAYALSQGIQKTYQEMSQAEQVALRYGYIMQATADAQGDFARTADGYANSMRRIETAWESIKTTVGSMLLPTVEAVTSSIAGLLENLTAPRDKTIFEKLAEIDFNYENEIAQIEQTHEKARALIDALESLHADQSVSETASTIDGLLSMLSTKIPELNNALQSQNPTEKIQALAAALSPGSGVSLDTWTKALESYEDFAGKLQEAMASDNPAEEIHKLAEELSAGSDISVENWESVLSTLAEVLSANDVKANAASLQEVINGLSTTIPGLSTALDGKDVAGQISELANALAPKTGVDVGVWTKALENYNSFAEQLQTAMTSSNPAGEIEKLAEQLSAGSGISVEDWKTVLNEMASALSSNDIKQNASSLESVLSDLGETIPGLSEKLEGKDVAGKISELAQALAPSTGVNMQAWTQALSSFDEFSGKLSAAMSSDNPAEEIKKLADELSRTSDIKPEDWNTMLTKMAEALKNDDLIANASSTAGAIESVSGAVETLKETSLSDALKEFTTDAGNIDSTSVTAWSKLLSTFSSNMTGFKNAIKGYDGGNNDKIANLAKALSGIDGDDAKIKAWNDLLGALSANLSDFSEAVGWDPDRTANWLNTLSVVVGSLKPDQVEQFDKLMQSLSSKGNLGDLSTIGTGAKEAAEGVSEVNEALDSAYYASEAELSILRQLVQMFPQLASVVNTTTGEIQGGIQALNDFVDASEAAQIKGAMQKRVQAQRAALEEEELQYWQLRGDIAVNEAQQRIHEQEMAKIRDELGDKIKYYQDMNGDWAQPDENAADLTDEEYKRYLEYERRLDDLQRLRAEKNQKVAQADEMKKMNDEARESVEQLAKELGIEAEAAEESAEAHEQQAMAVDDAKKALDSLKDALQSIIDYQNKAKDAALSNLDAVAHGFDAVDTKSEEYRKIMNPETMSANLASQMRYLEDYNNLLDKAKEKGVSDDVLSSIADGSIESMQYLRGLAGATEKQISQLNEQYAKVFNKKDSLASKIAAERLSVDKEYQAMIQAAQEMAAQMDQSATAGAGAAATIEAVVSAVAAGRAELESEVAAVAALLAQLGNMGNGYSVGGATGGIIGSTGAGAGVGHAGNGTSYVSGHALGLDYVPYDGYLAQLHRGETILTADEAAIWRNFTGAGSGQDQQAFDYDMLSASISSGIPSNGGNVYLDGKTVGRVISNAMGASYRQLERSGWRG